MATNARVGTFDSSGNFTSPSGEKVKVIIVQWNLSLYEGTPELRIYTSLNRTPFPTPSTTLACISTSEMRTLSSASLVSDSYICMMYSGTTLSLGQKNVCGKGVLFREVSSVQEFPHKGVPL